MNCLIKTWHIERQLALAVTWVMEQKMDFYSIYHASSSSHSEGNQMTLTS